MTIKFFLYLLSFSIALSSCDYRLLVKKERVINKKTGFIFFTNDNDYFIPCKISRMDYCEAFIKNKKLNNVGFLLSNFNRDKRFNFIQMYCDTVNSKAARLDKSTVVFIVPVVIEYYTKSEKNIKLNKEAKTEHEYSIQSMQLNIKYNMKTNYVINIRPFYTNSRIDYLENKYLQRESKGKN